MAQNLYELRFFMRWFCLAIVISLSLAGAAQAGDLEDCNQSKDRALTIRGCTRLIEQGQYKDVQLAAVYSRRASAYLYSDKYEDAISDYSKALEIAPQLTDARNNRGLTYRLMKQPDRAIEDHNAVIEMGTKDARAALAHYHRGLAYRVKGDSDRAMADFSEAITLNPKDADFFIARARGYSQKGDNERVVADYTQAIGINPKSASAYNGRAWALFKLGRAAEGLPDANQAVSLSPTSAHALDTRAHIHEALRKYAEATADFDRAFTLDPNIPESKEGLKRMVPTLHSCMFGEFAKLAEAIKVCFSVEVVHLGNPTRKKLFLKRGQILFDNNQFSNAASEFGLAADIGPSDQETYFKLGLANHRFAEQQQAPAWLRARAQENGIKAYRSAIALGRGSGHAEAQRGIEALEELNIPPELPEIMSAASDNPDELKRYIDAMRKNARYRIAIPAAEKRAALTALLGEKNPAALDALATLGNLYAEAGRLDDAELCLRYLKDNVGTVQTFVDLARVQRKKDRLADARATVDQGMAVYDRGSRNDTIRAYILHELAQIQHSQGTLADAEANYKKALELWKGTNLPDLPPVARIALDLAALHVAQERYNDAAPQLERALAVLSKDLPAEHPDLVRAQYIKGGIEIGLQHWPTAYEAMQQAVSRAIARSTVEGQAPRAITRVRLPHVGLGEEITSDGRRVVAGFTILNTDTPYTVGLSNADPSLSVLPRSAHLDLISSAYRLFETTKDQKQSAALRDEAFRAAQWTMHNRTVSAIASMAARNLPTKRDTRNLLRERQDLSASWQSAAAQNDGPKDAAAAQRVRDNTHRMELQIAALDARIRLSAPKYFDIMGNRPFTVAEVQALLSPDETLILFALGEKESFGWAVTQTSARWVRYAIGAEPLRSKVQALQCGLDAAFWLDGRDALCKKLLSVPYAQGDAEAGKPLPFSLPKSHELYQLLLVPFGELLRDNLIIVPSGPLTQVPFQVLVAENPAGGFFSSAADFRTAKWAGTKYAMTTLPSVSTLGSLRRGQTETAAEKPFMGVGNPALTGDARRPSDVERAEAARGMQTCQGSKEVQAGARRGIGLSAIRRGTGLADVEVLRHLEPLPETAKELCDVANRLGVASEAVETDVLLGQRATEAAIKWLNQTDTLSKYRIVHFATHGALAGEVDGIAEPGLILTPPGKATDIDDGYLTASEITQLKLNADWVILSACNTAAGGAESAEALSGLARAFFYAGARSLLVSHWAVNSEATTLLITDIFKSVAEKPQQRQSQALKASMSAMIARGGPYAHPAMWAPFVMVGGQR
ncbi:MAG: CHAT domain-containing protein [Hyphomicrobiaceae bacterium]|nr:CHAT domain-containing protein [Hyphomicrobiaceae bacterium]